MATRDTSYLVERIVPALKAAPALVGSGLGWYNMATETPRRLWLVWQVNPDSSTAVAINVYQATNFIGAGAKAVDAVVWKSVAGAAMTEVTPVANVYTVTPTGGQGLLVIAEVAYDDLDIDNSFTWLGLQTDLAGTSYQAMLMLADIPTGDATYYATRAQFKAFVGNIDDLVDDSTIDLCLGAASRAIDGHCGRRFWKAVETRYFTPRDSETLMLPDLVSVSTNGLKTDDDLDDVHETTWATTDFVLRPRNAPYSSPARPYTEIKVTRAGRYQFIRGVDSVEITGMWGWPTLPTEITLACLEQAHRFFARRGSPFGVIGTPDVGTLALLSAKLDPDVAVKLEPFVSSLGAL